MKINFNVKFILYPDNKVKYNQLIKQYKLNPKDCVDAESKIGLRGIDPTEYVRLFPVDSGKSYQDVLCEKIRLFIREKLNQANFMYYMKHD